MKNRTIQYTAIAIAALFTMTACTTINPYTDDKQASKAAIGAGIGAASGAIIGLLSSDSEDRRRNVLLGAGIGAIAGGSVGYYMDVQEAKLRQQLRGSGVSVTRSGDQIILNMPGNVTFATGSPNINSGFYDVLNSVTIVLKEYEKTSVDVIGHTDSVGSETYNQRLSEKRAQSVAQYLSGQGIMSARLLMAGRGEAQPIASNSTPQGRSQNRRVNIQISPIVQQ